MYIKRYSSSNTRGIKLHIYRTSIVQQRGKGKQRFVKAGQAGSRGGCLKNGGAGTLLRIMTSLKSQKISSRTR